MSLGVIGIDPTRVTTSPEFALGVRGAVEDQTTGSGVREYIYVSYPASTARVIGDVVALNASASAVALTVTNSAPGQAVGRRVGVVTGTVASSASVQYGWAQVYGIGGVSVLASAVLNTTLNTTATAGALDDDATAGSEVIDGLVLAATNGGAAAVVNAYLNYPFVGRTL